MTVLLQLDSVSKFYGALKAVDTVNLSVEDGVALGVIGPNGADMTTKPPHARSRMGIGRSYQIPHPFANMSVFENLLVGAIFGGRASERESYGHCAAILELTGLIGRANA